MRCSALVHTMRQRNTWHSTNQCCRPTNQSEVINCLARALFNISQICRESPPTIYVDWVVWCQSHIPFELNKPHATTTTLCTEDTINLNCAAMRSNQAISFLEVMHSTFAAICQ